MRNIDKESLDAGCNAYREYSENLRPRPKKRLITGIFLTKSTGFFGNRENWIDLPNKPNKKQKWLAYIMLKLGLVYSVHLEHEIHIVSAFKFNAKEIFSW